MSPRHSENPDPYQERRQPEQRPRQAGSQPPGGQDQQAGRRQASGQQGGGQRGGGQQGGRNQHGRGTQGRHQQQSRQQGGPRQGTPQQAGPHHGGHQQGSPEQFAGQPSSRGGGGPQRGSSSGVAGSPSGGQPPSQHPQQPPQQPSQQPTTQPSQASPQQQAPQAGVSPTQQPLQQFATPGQVDRMEGPGLESAPIDEILQSEVVTVEPDAAITDVVDRMASDEVGSVIVVKDDEPVGIITDRSIALAIQESPDLTNHTAGDFLSNGVVTGTTGMTVFDVLDQLEDHGIRRLPIVDDEGALQGIVTLDDVFVLLNAEMENATAIIESQSPRF